MKVKVEAFVVTIVKIAFKYTSIQQNITVTLNSSRFHLAITVISSYKWRLRLLLCLCGLCITFEIVEK